VILVKVVNLTKSPHNPEIRKVKLLFCFYKRLKSEADSQNEDYELESVALFIRGIIIGFSAAAPVGPIGILCIQRTLSHGKSMGLATGMGAAAADLVYGLLAGFGITIVTNFILEQAFYLNLFGSAFLFYLAWQIVHKKEDSIALRKNVASYPGAFASTFFLMISNPIAVLFFFGIFAAIGPKGGNVSIAAVFIFAAGVTIGSGLWWVILSGAVSSLRNRFKSEWLKYINLSAGIMIFGFAIWSFSQIWQ